MLHIRKQASYLPMHCGAQARCWPACPRLGCTCTRAGAYGVTQRLMQWPGIVKGISCHTEGACWLCRAGARHVARVRTCCAHAGIAWGPRSSSITRQLDNWKQRNWCCSSRGCHGVHVVARSSQQLWTRLPAMQLAQLPGWPWRLHAACMTTVRQAGVRACTHRWAWMQRLCHKLQPWRCAHDSQSCISRLGDAPCIVIG